MEIVRCFKTNSRNVFTTFFPYYTAAVVLCHMHDFAASTMKSIFSKMLTHHDKSLVKLVRVSNWQYWLQLNSDCLIDWDRDKIGQQFARPHTVSIWDRDIPWKFCQYRTLCVHTQVSSKYYIDMTYMCALWVVQCLWFYHKLIINCSLELLTCAINIMQVLCFVKNK